MTVPNITTEGRGNQLATERALRIVQVASGDRKDLFQNTETLWHPIWARGIFGGALVAQSLIAADQTTPPGFFVHSMHCQFIRPARTETRLTYHVKRVRDGNSLVARSVGILQNGECIFTAQLSFAREAVPYGNPFNKTKSLAHQSPVPPQAIKSGPPTIRGKTICQTLVTRTCQAEGGSLYECVRIPRDGRSEQSPDSTKLLQWVRVCRTDDNICERNPRLSDDSIKTHLAALAYVTDHYFIGTALRVNNGQRFANSKSSIQMMSTFNQSTIPGKFKLRQFTDLIQEEVDENAFVAIGKSLAAESPPVTAELMVSLNHTIYFHEPTAVAADDWMLFESQSPWTGHERGLVVEKIWNSAGILIATCVQEGMIRVKQDGPETKL